ADGRRLMLVQDNGDLTLHEVPTGREVKRINLGLKPSQVAPHPDGSKVAVASLEHQEVQVRDLATGDVLQKLPTPALGGSVAWHPDGLLLAVACQDMNVYVWDTATAQPHAVLRGHQSGGIGVAFAPGGDVLLSYAWDGTSRLWDPWTGRELLRLP